VKEQTKIAKAFPMKNIYFTECGGTQGSHFAGDLQWDMTNLVIGATQNWARCVLKWNLALDEQCGPKIKGGHEDGRGVVTISQNGMYKRNVEYYALGHASKFVRPGAIRINRAEHTDIPNLDYSVFRHAHDDSFVLVLFNKADQEISINVNFDLYLNCDNPYDNHSTFVIDKKSACTLIFKQNEKALKIITNQSRSDLVESNIDQTWLAV
jgi:glucosylceramidase